MAMTDTGRVICWGDNDYNQCNSPSDVHIVAISAGAYHSAGITSSGTVVCWGDNEHQECHPPVGLENVVGISCGYSISAALLQTGRVVCWGRNDSGRCEAAGDLEHVAAISVGGPYNLVSVRQDGTVVCWDVAGDEMNIEICCMMPDNVRVMVPIILM
jgi:alpha-tubulin suppressor-like RCC1 family protein